MRESRRQPVREGGRLMWTVGVAGAAGWGTRGRGRRPSHKEQQLMPAASVSVHGSGVVSSMTFAQPPRQTVTPRRLVRVVPIPL